jgi:hypothetical protein
VWQLTLPFANANCRIFRFSGFDREDEWGFRALEPSRCCISSIALVLLKTGIQHFADAEKQAEIDYSQMATAQKLLLFWRKPAVRVFHSLCHLALSYQCRQRKCWWDGMDVDLPATDSAPAATIKLWARRVWTLELSLVGVTLQFQSTRLTRFPQI